MLAGAAGALAGLGFAPRASAQATRAAPPTVITNFQLFDGKSLGLRGGQSLRIEDGRIKQVAGAGQGAPEGARLIDCGGRVLMPGLIDAHWHVMFASLNPAQLLTADIGFVFLSASAQAERTLMRGFTTVRDLGGPSFPLKKAIDSGLAVGPRIYPCGAVITTTGGHGDMRMNSDVPRSPGGPQSQLESMGAAAIADSADEVRLRVREQLFLGASQIKMIGGGGVASPRTTLDMVTFTVPELRVGVEATADRNTYVAVHAYPPAAIQRAIDAGVQCIEHGHLIDEATAKLMADKGVWLSTQPFIDETDNAPMTGQSRINLLQVLAGTPTMYGYAKKYGIKTAWGSDLLFSSEVAERQGVLLNSYVALVQQRRGSQDGNGRQRRAAGAVRSAQSLPWKARGHRGRRLRRPARGGGRSAPGPQSARRTGQEPCRHNEGRQDPQGRSRWRSANNGKCDRIKTMHHDLFALQVRY